jgi:hypothetical protein
LPLSSGVKLRSDWERRSHGDIPMATSVATLSHLRQVGDGRICLSLGVS